MYGNARKTMLFVDGENLVFRFQEMVESGFPTRPEVIHDKDTLVWHPKLSNYKFHDLLRVSYYTSAVGDDSAINELKKKISQIPVQFSTAMNKDITTICPYVFKNLRSSQKIRNVDINLTIDVMRFAYLILMR